MRLAKFAIGAGTAFTGAWVSTALLAQDALETIGKPVPGGMGFQPAATELKEDIAFLDGFLLVIITAIVLLVTGLLAVCIFRFNAKANPTPATFTHHSALEIAWTVVPILILIVIGSLSLPILFKQLEVPDSDLTIKVTGNQWYWSYEYPDEEISFDSVLLQRDELAEHGYAPDEYLLATDTAVVVPVGAVVRLQITGADVIHSWTIPSFGVKLDAIPGRLQETWFRVDRPGVFFGQCSELCGKDHAYMPIVVKAMEPEAYATWLEGAKQEFAMNPAARTIRLASN
ncbi:cytochrome c oxidase subunit II (plasmid) [Paroceanicella profunda]|uniref:Cytochrome c oxidase subunit 2 n=1 Tax=Paroceanicella profunda TaxID=2579971 RepID=A0A5B8FJD6_9RHOB|nr:cytochrome c oxidase subunit II [Paroceanicella profunda]QDL94188.1 cytochrome c oxidase subunit II [Paroceanicella profunda]